MASHHFMMRIMQQTRGTWLNRFCMLFMLFMGLLIASACSSKSSTRAIEPLRLVPKGADFLAGIDLKAFYGSKAYAVHREQLEYAAYGEFLRSAAACDLDLRKFDAAYVGANAKGEFAAIVAGQGVGDGKRLECLAKALERDGVPKPFRIRREGGQSRLEISAIQLEGVIFLANDNLLAYVSQGWADAVSELLEGKGETAIDGDLQQVFADAPKDKQIWFSGRVPPATLASDPTAGLTQLGGSIEFADGLNIRFDGRFKTELEATASTERLRAVFKHVKGYAGMFGIPDSVVQRVEIANDKEKASVSVAATAAELQQLQRALSNISGGALLAPPIPGAARRAPDPEDRMVIEDTETLEYELEPLDVH